MKKECSKCINISENENTCPYILEVHGETEICNCCDSCYHQCLMDI